MYRAAYITLIGVLSLGFSLGLHGTSAATGVGSQAGISDVLTRNQGQTLEQARALFLSGAYDQARLSGQNIGTPDGLILASEALSAQIILGLVEKPHKQSKIALDLARKALDVNPENSKAVIQYALTYGLLTRTSNPMTAWRKKYPAKSLKIIENLRQDFPDDPRGDALLGAWHLGVIRKAGAKNGAKWFGADLETGLTLYETAKHRAPQDIIIASNYAISRFVIAPDIYQTQTQALLEDILKLPAKTALEHDVQLRMADILDQFDHMKLTIKKSKAFLDSKKV